MAKAKKSFDKELMYKKIMPSNLRKSSEQCADEHKNDEETTEIETDISINADNIYIFGNSVSDNEEDKEDKVGNEENEIDRDLEQEVMIEQELSEPEKNDNLMQEEEKSGIVLCNIMEKLVLEKLDMTLKKMNCCKCDRCREDIIALSLNSLKPMYIVATKDEIDSKVEELDKISMEVTTAVLKAVLFIRKNPRH